MGLKKSSKTPKTLANVFAHNTTANPRWMHATSPLDIIPTCDDPDGEGERRMNRLGCMMITQGPHAGQRLRDHWAPWQPPLLRFVFARKIRRLLLKLGKGAGKTSISAGFAVEAAMSAEGLGHYRGLCVIVAASVEQARLAFGHAMEAILADQTIKGLFKSNVVERTVTHVPSGFVVKIIAPEVKAAAGLRPVLTILDEVAIASHEREYAACVDQLRRGSRNWPDSLEVSITTADPARPVGHYKTELAYARGVRDGLIKDESFLPILFEFPVLERPELDVTDHQQWWRGLPSVGHTIALAELQDEYREAQAKGSLDMRNFLSQRLGVESDVIAASDESDNIQSLWARGVVTADESTMQQADVVVIGNDPGGIADPHGVCILWRANGSLHAIVKQFCVQSAVDNADAEAKAVFDHATLADELFVFDQVTQMDEGIVGLISQIVADVQGGIGCPVIIGGDLYGRAGFSQMLAQTTGMEYRKAQQGFVSGSALSQLEGLIHDGMIKVTGGPLLDSNFTNLKVDDKGQTRRIGKADGWLSGAGHRHIDGVSALLSALTLLSEAPPAFDASCLIAPM